MDTSTLIRRVYAAFNRRDTEAALALMTTDVTWPKASEGGNVTGKEAIRAYWTRQWSHFNPHVDPLTITEDSTGRVSVHVHQIVKNLQGDVLADGEVLHIFTLHNGLIAAMNLGGEAGNADDPSAAFTHYH